MIQRIIIGFISLSFLAACSSKPPHTNSDDLEVKTVGHGTKEVHSPGTTSLPNVVGLWKSTNPEPAGNGHFRIREYSMSPKRWELTTTLFADKELKKIIFIYRADGPYAIEDQSKTVPGAFQAIFHVNQKTLNYKHKDSRLKKELGMKSCGLKKGKEIDITQTGCGEFKSANECGQEFDLVKIENGNLRLGERPSDNELCSLKERPESLGPALKKIN